MRNLKQETQVLTNIVNHDNITDVVHNVKKMSKKLVIITKRLNEDSDNICKILRVPKL